MKVLIINGSPKANGCTNRALSEVIKVLNAEGIETELYQISRNVITGCRDCGACRNIGKCVINDDVNELAKKFEEADGLIVGSPVYYAGANGSVLSLLDRLFFSSRFDKSMKVGAAVLSSRRGGSTSAFDEINKYFTISNMPIASSTYWNEVHGFTPEDVEKDLEGLQVMRNLGRSMAFLIKAIRLAKEKYGNVEVERGARTCFHDGK
jgi:multimeric flavodoxin WrbA